MSPEVIKKSAITDFNLVCPVFISSPIIITPSLSASSTIPGTNVFWGEPLIYGQCSKIAAAQYIEDGLISFSLFLIPAKRASAVPWIFGSTSQNLSVLPFHKIITLSKLFLALKSFIFCLTVSNCFSLFPSMTLSALESWFGATKDKSKTAGRGIIFSVWSLSWLYIVGSNTFALLVASYIFNFEISHPLKTISFGSTIGTKDLNGATYVLPVSSWPKYVVEHWVSEPW